MRVLYTVRACTWMACKESNTSTKCVALVALCHYSANWPDYKDQVLITSYIAIGYSSVLYGYKFSINH